MNKLFEILKETYEKTVEDNKRDFISTYGKLSKLCLYLINKNILTSEEIQDILSTDNVDYLKGEK